MRKLIFLSILALAFTACNNVGKFKESIESLSSDWESTTSQVMAVVDQVSQAQTQAKSAMETMQPSEELAAQLNEEQKDKIGELQQKVQEQMATLGDLSKEAFEFVNKWQENGEKLEALEEGLSSGNLPSDAQSTIDELRAMVETANEKVSSWSEQANGAKEAVSNATQSYNEIVASAGGEAQ